MANGKRGNAAKKKGLSKEEVAAMREHLKELNMKEEGESAVLAKIAEMPEPDRSMGKKLHAIIKTCAPHLIPRTWYGMPAYSNKGGNVMLFFRSRDKFKERYMTLGFNDDAKLDDGKMWPVVYALTGLGAKEEKEIAELVRKAVG